MINSEELRIAMLKKNITSRSLAQELKISDNTFSRKINNQFEFKVSEIRAIASVLGLTDEEIAKIFLHSL